MKVEDAKWIYSNCISGTKVEFYSDTVPGPLGKPTAKKITGDEAVRNWDPTDPDPDNPWSEYLKKKEETPTPSMTPEVSASPNPSSTPVTSKEPSESPDTNTGIIDNNSDSENLRIKK